MATKGELRTYKLVCKWCDKEQSGTVFRGSVQIKKLTNWTFDTDRGWLCPSCTAALPSFEKLKRASMVNLSHEGTVTGRFSAGPNMQVPKCTDGQLPDGPVCPACGGRRGPSGVGGGTWVHY